MLDEVARTIALGRVHVCSFGWDGFLITRWRYLLIIILMPFMHIAPRSFWGVSTALLNCRSQILAVVDAWRTDDCVQLHVEWLSECWTAFMGT